MATTRSASFRGPRDCLIISQLKPIYSVEMAKYHESLTKIDRNLLVPITVVCLLVRAKVWILKDSLDFYYLLIKNMNVNRLNWTAWNICNLSKARAQFLCIILGTDVLCLVSFLPYLLDLFCSSIHCLLFQWDKNLHRNDTTSGGLRSTYQIRSLPPHRRMEWELRLWRRIWQTHPGYHTSRRELVKVF